MNPLRIDRGAALAALRSAAPPGQWAVDTSWRRTSGGRYFLQVKIRGTIVEALYDPGSEVTLIHQDIFNLINQDGNLNTVPIPCRLEGAFNGTPGGLGIPSQGIRMDICAGGRQRSLLMLVHPHLCCDMIAGTDFIDQFGISLNAKKQRLEFPAPLRFSPPTAPASHQ